MNLQELGSFKLSDAITFHDELNTKLWHNNNLRPEVKEQLILIAQDFLEELGINDFEVKDITVSGSNAAYSYTPHSDLDLHILVDMSRFDDDIYKEFFHAKKSLYNEAHDIKIHGVPVEVYVQDSREPVVSLGEYSVMQNKWLRLPTKRRANFDQSGTKAKYETLLHLIQIALKSKDLHKVQKITNKIKQYRQAGLDKGGEFGPENLAYKALRSQGYITKLYDLRDKLHSEVLTIENMYQNPIHIQEEAEIRNYKKLDKILVKLCRMIVEGQISDKGYGMVAACVLDPNNNMVARLNYLEPNGKRVHAERAAVEAYENKYGSVPEGSIVVTTLSPCNETDDETAEGRVGESCAEYLNGKGIEKVFCGYIDPTQDNDIRNFSLMETSDKSIREECKKFADTFLNEARTNPEQNIKYGSGKYELLGAAEDIRDKENWAVSMTLEPKLGINPQAGVSEDTPKGIYFYPLDYFIRMVNRNESLPWGDNMPYLQLFQYDRSGEMTQQTKVEPAKLYKALSQYCPEKIIQQAIDDGEYNNDPYWFIYDCLVSLGKGDETTIVRWNKVLRDLGFTSVFDPGRGWIAIGEPTQGVVLDPRIIKQHKTFDNRNPTGLDRKYDINHLADAIGWSSYYNSESQRQQVPYSNPDKKKIMLAVANNMLRQFLGKTSKEAKEMGFDQALKDAADKVIEILKSESVKAVAESPLQFAAEKTADISPYAGVEDSQFRGGIYEASGYIPSEKEKNDPRFKTALTVDVKPDSIKKNAKSFYWTTSRAGIPPTLNPNGKF